MISGHSFRRTSATILANNGADLETIMRHGRWRNGSCARGYIEESLQHKARTGQLIQCSVMGSVSTTFAEGLKVAPTSTFAGPVNGKSVPATSSLSSVGTVENDLFDSSIGDAELINAVERASQIYEEQRDDTVPNERSENGTDRSLSLAVSNNGSFKSVNFERIENCTFNFYVNK